MVLTWRVVAARGVGWAGATAVVEGAVGAEVVGVDVIVVEDVVVEVTVEVVVEAVVVEAVVVEVVDIIANLLVPPADVIDPGRLPGDHIVVPAPRGTPT